MSVKGFKDFVNCYEFEAELPGSHEIVKFKPITTGQLKKLLIYENVTDPSIIEDALDDLISSSVVSEGFDIGKLELQDRFFLLIEIRKKTNGETYKFSHTCGVCKNQSLQNIHLDRLPFKPKNDDVERTIKLNDDISVTLDYINRGDQKLAYSHIKKDLNEPQFQAEMALVTHACGVKEITTPNGVENNLSIEDKLYILENVSTDMYEKIRNWYDINNYGTTFKVDIICTCGHKAEINVPLDNFFF